MARYIHLDIAIGDVAKHHDESRRHDSVKNWVTQWGTTYGFSSNDFDQISSTEKDTLRDILANDPTAQTEAWLVDPPKNLGGGRLVIELFDKECPKTCENFASLCKGGKIGKSSKKPLYYKDTLMFRLAPNYMVQGGDVTRGNILFGHNQVLKGCEIGDGSGGDSIYNGKFNDEKPGLAKQYSQPGVIAMANSGKNSNTSQFFITLGDKNSNSAQFSKINGKYVIFGQVVEGLEVLTEINTVPVQGEKPLSDITILNCGDGK
ncbi:cyclophilin-like domain-containing protein [Phycomyces nitens]|nr:cyclophilin-like domain-containing protein [Phycomyces nitens]